VGSKLYLFSKYLVLWVWWEVKIKNIRKLSSSIVALRWTHYRPTMKKPIRITLNKIKEMFLTNYRISFFGGGWLTERNMGRGNVLL